MNLIGCLVLACTPPIVGRAQGNPWRRPGIPDQAALKKLPKDGGANWNRLVFEMSPYLQQHAANPVDWYPWGEEAFARAKAENKPVFLSIGYSTCHWCHVMERESFEDQEVAKLLNSMFVCIKVDREERPDIDEMYMTFCQAMTGSGGWPLTLVLTPDKRPFFAGTYFPKTSRYGRVGMLELLPKLQESWLGQREKIDQVADYMVRQYHAFNAAPSGSLGPESLQAAFRGLAGRFDFQAGGFGRAPKFPTPHQLMFLLRYWKRTGEAQALHMVVTTLTRMRQGGIYDQVGHGFHRYSTDANWLVPHFEKMLYDQALLALAYLEAFQATGTPLFEQTAREILAYVQRDLRAPEGGFYSAEDADSEGVEGLFYLWGYEEWKSVLGEAGLDRLTAAFGVQKGGNYQEQTAEGVIFNGLNILHQPASIPELAKRHGLSESQVREELEGARQKLWAARSKRVRPLRDDKILTDWNGLMIAAFARAASVLQDPAYEEVAKQAADFILAEMRGKDGRLLKRYRNGVAGLPAHLDDYAFFSWGLLELYEATFEIRYLEAALAFSHHIQTDFADSSGGYFLTGSGSEDLIVRPKSMNDGALPAGNSVAALNAMRLAGMTGDSQWAENARNLFKSFPQALAESATFLMMALEFDVAGSREIVLVGAPGEGSLAEIRQAIFAPYSPNKVVLFKSTASDELSKIAPFTRDQRTLDGHATLYVCRNFSCKAPTTSLEKMREFLSPDGP